MEEEAIPIRDILIDWLSTDNVQKKQSTLYSMCTYGTGSWFLHHPQFVHWYENQGEVLWCPGFPGVGKSCIMSLAVHHLQGLKSMDESPVLFYYFDYKEELRTLENIFETLLCQLITCRLPDNTRRELTSLKARKYRPAFEDLIPIIEREINSYKQCFILIDALDEFTLEEMRNMFIKYIQKLFNESKVNLMIFSRDNIPEITEDMQWAKRLDIIDHTEDIQCYIENQIDNTKKIKWLLNEAPSIQQEVVETVLSMSKGMFLAAHLHMDTICNCISKADVLETLKKLPPKLNETYDAAIQRIKTDDVNLAFKVFSWILHSRRPLTFLELRHALAIQANKDIIQNEDLFPEQYIKSICVGLITIQSESDGSPVVGFVCKYFIIFR
ncbi:hypothetical protein BDQ17DRAFT_1262049 [Cyathus striatus]|nr:hypothetical protein BDQ17DRAFT_1262049 [Cyathus striatus]